MKTDRISILGILAIVGTVAVAGCNKNSETPGVGERTGAALDEAAEKTAAAAKTTAAAAKDAAGQAVQKTGEVLEKAGSAVEKTGADMQK